jgi:hypothetical protein
MIGLRGWALFTVVTLFPASAIAVSGNEWRALDEGQKSAYVIGIIDGWGSLRNANKVVGEKYPEFISKSVSETIHLRLVKCMDDRNMLYGQAIAIVTKYMDANPEVWDHPMAGNVFYALGQTCG